VHAYVLRESLIRQIDAEKLVVGDIISLKAGMKAPADARLITLRDLETNEALLTGESTPIKKHAKSLKGRVPLADRKNMVFMGTSVVKGEALAVVVATGANSEIGKIAKLTQAAQDEETPLQEKLKRLSKIISIFVSISAVVILIIGLFEKIEFADIFTTSIAVAVASIPEGLPAALSIILAVAGQRIFKEKGLIKHLNAAETLGSTNIICADKTGTLTEGKMKVEKIISYGDKKIILEASAFANEATLDKESSENVLIHGDPTDQAKMEVFLKNGGDVDELLKKHPLLARLPFDQSKNYLASFNKLKKNRIAIYINGAPEAVLKASVSIKEGPTQKPLTKARLESLTQEYEQLAKRGFRIIAVAYKEIAKNPDSIDFYDTKKLHQLITGLSFYGFLAIRDPIREDVLSSIQIARQAGLKVIMITGDHKLTARAIGGELGFATKAGAIIEGEELDALSDKQLKERVEKIEIYARVNPKHKMRIIEAWRSKNMVVAMTGDGINDAPALKTADIGIAVGSGTDVTKEASDLVLLDNSFSLIPQAIRQGRIAFDNIRKVSLVLLVGAFTELLLILSALILRVPLPITALQILWANLIEDGLPALALAFEPGEEDIMKRKPLRRAENILDRQGIFLVFVVGLITDLMLVGFFLLLYNFTNLSIEHIRTIIFIDLSTDVLFYIFAFKSLSKPLIKINIFNNKYLIGAVIIGLLLAGAVIYVPFLNKFMDTVPLSLFQLLIILMLTSIKISLIELVKYIFRRRSGKNELVAQTARN